MQLPKIAINNYQFTLIVFVLLIIAGISSYLSMPRTENPPIYIPGAGVLVVYPGTSPVDMEELVAIPIENAINELDDIKKINTTLKDGIAFINVEFIWGTDADEKYDEVVEKVNSIRNDLPSDIMRLEIDQWSSADVVIFQFAFVSDSAEFYMMKEEAEDLKKSIEKVDGVRKVELLAFPEREVRIALDLEKMAAMNISSTQVAKAIQSNNANIPGGSIEIGNKSFGVKTSGSYSDLDDIRSTVVSSYMGRLIYLHHIASVYFDYEDEDWLAAYNGRRAMYLTVQQKEDYNIFDISDEIKEKVSNHRNELHTGIELHTVFDQSEGVDNRVNGFFVNLLQGIVLVGIVILLSLGFRSAIIVIIAIPLSIIIALFFVDEAGFGIQQISIAGLVVALGLLVDNSIVVVENINRFIQQGNSRKEAAVKGTSEIGWPVISATITTVFAFIPIIMMPDKAGEFIRSLPVTIIATLGVSLIIALSLTPLIASRLLPKKRTNKENLNFFKKTLRGIIEGPYRKTLRFALDHKVITLSVAILTLFISAFIGVKFVGVSFFPKAEQPQFMIRANLPEGTNLQKTKEVAGHIESVLDTVAEVEKYTTNVGHGNPRIYYNVFPKNYEKNYAEIFVRTKSYDFYEFNKLVGRLRKTFEGYPGAEINIKEFEQGPPVEAPVAVYIIGEDVEVLRKIAGEVEDFIRSTPGAISVENILSKKRTDLRIIINREKAGMLGVPVHEIDKTIRMAVSGLGISTFHDESGDAYDIVIRAQEGSSIQVRDFDKIFVTSHAGKQIPINMLANIEFEQNPGIVSRYDLERNAAITADIGKGYTLDDVMKPVIKMLEEYKFPAGYSYHIAGELESRSETFGGMLRAIIIALVAIFSVLVLQFRSFSQPLIIYTAIPLAVIGSVWALFITGYTFSFTAFIGLISLVGIVINNSIILVDYSNQLLREKTDLKQAVAISGETRFTPIVLTALTTIGGLLPLTLAGGSLWAPLGWTIIGGLAVSTFLTLIVVPVLYLIFTTKS